MRNFLIFFFDSKANVYFMPFKGVAIFMKMACCYEFSFTASQRCPWRRCRCRAAPAVAVAAASKKRKFKNLAN